MSHQRLTPEQWYQIIPNSSNSQLSIECETSPEFPLSPQSSVCQTEEKNQDIPENKLLLKSSKTRIKIESKGSAISVFEFPMDKSSEDKTKYQISSHILLQLVETLRLKGGKGSKRDSQIVMDCPDCKAAKARKASKIEVAKGKKERRSIQSESSMCDLHARQERLENEENAGRRRSSKSQTSDFVQESSKPDERNTVVSEEESVGKGDDAESRASISTGRGSDSEMQIPEKENRESQELEMKPKRKKDSKVSIDLSEQEKAKKTKKDKKNKSELEIVEKGRKRSLSDIVGKWRRGSTQEEGTQVEFGSRSSMVRFDEQPGPSGLPGSRPKKKGTDEIPSDSLPFYTRLGINATDAYKISMFLIFYNLFNALK